MTDLIARLNDEMADMVDRVRRSLVHISNGGQSHGAGIVLTPDGLILTNAHVVRRRSLRVTLSSGETLVARVVAYDPERDLAALKVDAQGLLALDLADSTELQPGEWVFAVGHPWGVPGAVTSGVAISAGAEVNGRRASAQEWLPVNLSLRPGNSGGPLVDAHGQLLGVNTVMVGSEVGLAVSAQVIKDFLRERVHGRHSDDSDAEDDGGKQPQTFIV
jgi:serine protease Do